MSSIRSQILTFLISALNGAGKPSGVTVDKYRLDSLEPSQLPSMIVYPTQEQVERALPELRSPVVNRTLTVRIECRASEASPATPDEMLDLMLTWAVKSCLADRTLGKLATDTQETLLEWSASGDPDADYAKGNIELTVRYATKTVDPEALP
jgi:hypothetical protein